MATQDILPTGFRMQQLLQNKTAYEEMLTWKCEGPQDSFLALVDVNAVSIYCAYKFFNVSGCSQPQFSLVCVLLPCWTSGRMLSACSQTQRSPFLSPRLEVQ